MFFLAKVDSYSASFDTRAGLFEVAKTLHFATGGTWGSTCADGVARRISTAVGLIEITPTVCESSICDSGYYFRIELQGARAKLDYSIAATGEPVNIDGRENICNLRAGFFLAKLDIIQVLDLIREAQNHSTHLGAITMPGWGSF